MKQIIPLLALLTSCSHTPTFQSGRYESTKKTSVDLAIQLNREQVITLPLTLDSGVVLTPLAGDTSTPIIPFQIESWQGTLDQEELIAHVASRLDLPTRTMGDLEIFIPRTQAITILRQL